MPLNRTCRMLLPYMMAIISPIAIGCDFQEKKKNVRDPHVIDLSGRLEHTDAWENDEQDLEREIRAVAGRESEVTDLRLSTSDIGDLRLVRKLPRLKRVDLTRCPLSSESLADLVDLKELQVVCLGDTQIGDAGMKYIRQLPALEKLYLNQTKVTDDGLKELAGLNKLKELYLCGTPVVGATLRKSEVVKSLEYLDLRYTSANDATAEALSDAVSLKELQLSGTEITDKGLRHLTKLSNLTRLELQGTRVSSAGRQELIEKLPHCTIE